MSLYKDWGYISNPFKPSPIKPTLKDSSLLVGREKEKKKIKTRLKNDSGIITIEGENGIGKTSVINTSIYELFEESISSKQTDYFYIPCNNIFQISPKNDLTEFVDNFYFSIAQTIINKKNEIKKSGIKNLKVEHINKWLNSPDVKTIEAQIGGFGGSYNTSPNESEGFLKSGFKNNIKQLLNVIFPNSANGGIICIVDNLELLETSEDAKRTLEYLRDEIFNIPEIKWFFSGSHNIFRTFISTPRLSGFIQKPLKIDRLNNINVPSILKSRINSYQNHVDNKPYSPITEADFVSLFDSVNGNLREVFKRLSSYYLYVYEIEEEPFSEEGKNKLFKNWFEQDKIEEYEASTDVLQINEINLLKLLSSQNTNLITDKALDENGLTSFSELRNAIYNLEKYGIIYIPIMENEFITKNKYNKRKDLLKNILFTPKTHYIKQLLQE